MNDQNHSMFVTVLAWLGMLWSGFSILIGTLQLIFVAFAMPDVPPLSDAEAAALPLAARFMFSHPFLTVSVITIFWVAVCLSSRGLLKRREWARRAYVAVLAAGMFVIVAMGAIQLSMIGDMFGAAANTPPEAAQILWGVRLTIGFLTAMFAGVLGWITWKLCTPAIRAEFA